MESDKNLILNIDKLTNDDNQIELTEKELMEFENGLKNMDISETINQLSGKYYQGELINGKKEGKGLLIDLNGDIFEGIFINDKKEGFGVYLFESGKKYVGHFTNDVLNGVGSYFFINGSEYYGEIHETEMHGFGNYHYPSGSYYVGEFNKGEMDGIGTLYLGNERYEGEFKNDYMTGVGKYFHDDGDYFEGDFLNDHKNGFGITYYSNGERIEGSWKNNKKNGICTFYFKNGDYVINNYIDNIIEGNGYFIDYQYGNKLDIISENNEIKKFLNLEHYLIEKFNINKVPLDKEKDTEQKDKLKNSETSKIFLDIKNLKKLFEFFDSDPKNIFLGQLSNLIEQKTLLNFEKVTMSCLNQDCENIENLNEILKHIEVCQKN